MYTKNTNGAIEITKDLQIEVDYTKRNAGSHYIVSVVKKNGVLATPFVHRIFFTNNFHLTSSFLPCFLLLSLKFLKSPNFITRWFFKLINKNLEAKKGWKKGDRC